MILNWNEGHTVSDDMKWTGAWMGHNTILDMVMKRGGPMSLSGGTGFESLSKRLPILTVFQANSVPEP
jgi:hypothetical protein